MMEYRKLISFGKSSYVVSLPKRWVERNQLRKGDVIPVHDNHESLTLFAKTDKQEREPEQRIVISVDGKGIDELKRELIPAYINNYKMITLVGGEVREKTPQIKQLLHSLMALEVMEQHADRIIARDFLNLHEISIPMLVTKMDASARSMLADTKRMFAEDLYENIFSRDEDVNRLSYLSFRAIRYALRNPLIASQHYRLTSMELLNLWMLTSQLEYIADEAKRIARVLKRISLGRGAQEQVIALLGKIERNEQDMMTACGKKDTMLAHQVSAKKPAIVAQIKQLYEKNTEVRGIGALTEHLKIMTLAIHDIARSVYE